MLFGCCREDAWVICKYLQAALDLKKFHEVKRVVRECNFYPLEMVKDFLIQSNLQDHGALVNLCHRFGWVEELTTTLCSKGHLQYIEEYLDKLAPQKLPEVCTAYVPKQLPFMTCRRGAGFSLCSDHGSLKQASFVASLTCTCTFTYTSQCRMKARMAGLPQGQLHIEKVLQLWHLVCDYNSSLVDASRCSMCASQDWFCVCTT